MEEKEKKPKIRFKGFTEAWEQRKLDDISRITMGQSPDGVNYTENPEDNILIQGNADLCDGKVIPRIFTTQITKISKPNDIIFTVRAPVGEVAKSSYTAVIGRGVASLTGNNFLYHTLKRLNEINYWKKLSAGSTFDSINSEQLKNIEIDLPNKKEQNVIGDFFEKVDNLITLHQRKYDKLVNVKKSLLEKMFPKNDSNVPEIRFKGFTEAWEQRKLLDVAQYRNGKAHENDIDDDGKYVVINSKFVSTNGTIRKNSNKQNEPLFKNEIAFVLSDVPNGRALARTYIVEKSGKYTLNQRIAGITPNSDINSYYLYILMNRNKYFLQFDDGAKQTNLSLDDMKKFEEYYPKNKEQVAIGSLFEIIDNLITLHQHIRMGDKRMIKNKLFSVYYESWIKVYKEGAIRKVTMDKYKLTLSWIKKLAPKMTMKDLNRITYQELLNGYAEYHERQSTMDFHHQLKGAILDAVDDGVIDRDPTRKAIIKGKSPRDKKIKYLNQFELHKLISDLELENELNYDWLILLIAKTGMRFSEALAVTPKDFDLMHQMLIINKTWNYKDGGGFSPTKNESSNRKIQIDWQTAMQFAELIKELPEDKPIFAFNKVYNSTINDILARHCRKMEIPVISVHGLRHTHASILLFAGVSIASVAHRLGHSSMTTTQKTYLHIIQELENADIDLIMRSLSSLNR